MISAVQKQAIDYAIEMNPSPVVLHRVAYEPHEGARRKVEETLPEQNWLLFPKNQVAKKNREEGGASSKQTWGALAPSTADVRGDSDTTETFELSGIGTFEVVKVSALSVGTDLNGYRIDLKLVN